MFITGAFVLGEVLTLLPELVVIGVLALLAAGGLWFMVKDGRVRIILVLLFFLTAGYCRMRYVTDCFEDTTLMEAVREKESEVIGLVEDISRKSGSDIIRLGKCRVPTEEGTEEAGKILLYLAPELLDRNQESLKIGSKVSCFGELGEFEPSRNPGEFDARTYYRGLKIRYRMFGTGLRLCDETYSPYKDLVYRIKIHLSGILDQISEPEDVGIFQAALLGEKENLDQDVRKLYQKNGIAHLLAISGLHIALIGAGFYRLLRLCGIGFSRAGILSGLWIDRKSVV